MRGARGDTAPGPVLAPDVGDERDVRHRLFR